MPSPTVAPRVLAASLVLLPSASLAGFPDQASSAWLVATFASDLLLGVVAAALILRRPSGRVWLDALGSAVAAGLVEMGLSLAQSAVVARVAGGWPSELRSALLHGLWGIAKPGLLIMVAREAWRAPVSAGRACGIAGGYWLSFALPASILASMRNEVPPETSTFGTRDAVRLGILVAGSGGFLLCGLVAWLRAAIRRA